MRILGVRGSSGVVSGDGDGDDFRREKEVIRRLIGGCCFSWSMKIS